MNVWQPPDKEKRPSSPGDWREHKMLTYGFAVAATAWARWIERRVGCRPYLVGSALATVCPRDVDIALIWPDDVFAREFGLLPCSQEEYEALWQGRFQWATHALLVSAWDGIGYCPYVDIHLAPESWWPERPRLYLGGTGPLPQWPHVEAGYVLRTVTNQDGTDVLFTWSEEVPAQ